MHEQGSPPVVVAGCLVLGLIVAICGCAADPKPPLRDVLLITLDTTRADRLGCYGSTAGLTPNLDRLATESVLFELAIAQAAVTPVSHASILTGREPYRHGLRVLHGTAGNRLTAEQHTLAEVWRDAGGSTAAFVSAYPVTADFGLDQGFEVFDADFPQSDGEGLIDDLGVVNVGGSQRRADETTDAAIEWLEGRAGDDRPLLMWVHYFDPHDLLVVPPEAFLRGFESPSRDRTDVLRTAYDSEVAYMDEQIGRLLEAFGAHASERETVTVVVADHGEGLGDHDWWTHGILYQEQIRVPLIIHAPGLGGPRSVASPVRTTDLMPTLLEIAGIAPGARPSMDGSSLTGAMRGQTPERPGLAYADSINMLTYYRPDVPGSQDDKNDKLYCLTDGRYKLIYHQLFPRNTEFYDLSEDPGESHNLAAERPARMQEWIEELQERGALSDILPGWTDPERLEKLRSLGYVE